MTAHRAVVVSAAQEWVCPHRHRGEMAAMDCALREVRRRVTRRLNSVPRRDDPRRKLAQWMAFTREADDA